MDRSLPASVPPGPRSGRVQGRNSTVPLSHPVEVPEGEWALTLQTSWLEPAYVEPDASWCPAGPASRPPPWPTAAPSGASGAARHQPVPGSWPTRPARRCASLWQREDVVRRGPKRPPLAVALRPDGSGVVRVGRTEGSADLEPLAARVHAVSPGVEVEVVDVAGAAGLARPAWRRLGRGARGPGRARCP